MNFNYEKSYNFEMIDEDFEIKINLQNVPTFSRQL